jgi:transcriptional regulator with XRE-family HTH domain
MTFGERLRTVREKQGKGIVELGRLTGIPYETIYRLETGKHKSPRLDIAVKLARALGVPLDYLAGVYEELESEQQPADGVPVRA